MTDKNNLIQDMCSKIDEHSNKILEIGKELETNLFLKVYPVGSIYISANSTNPETLFGGKWTALDQGRVLIGANNTYKAGTTGGEFTHTITTDEMPSHNHSANSSSNGDHNHSLVSITGYDDHNFINGTGEFLLQNSDTTIGFPSAVNATLKYGSTGNAGSHNHSITVNSTGGSQPHNNMQPYLAVYMWQRTA